MKRNFDFLLFMTVLVLLSLGTVMVLSAGAPHAYNFMHGDAYFFLKKQIIYAILGVLAMFVMMNINYRKLAKISPVLVAISIVLLVLVLIPGIGMELNGARRWIGAGGITIQPSEFAKLAMILFFSHSLSVRKGPMHSFTKELLPYIIIIALFVLLLLMEPHMSCTITMVLILGIILFCAGAKIKHFIILVIPTLACFVTLMITSPYRFARITSFLNPWKAQQGSGWQVVQSLYAIGSGGIIGRGLGKSLQKYLYIPEPYNDFILAVLAEELGFIGVASVVILFLIFIWRGIRIAINAADMFGSLVAIGITSMVAVQFIINVAVVTSSMPVTGMPLPFFSYGGTSLIFLMAGIGVLLNISGNSKLREER